MDKTKKLKIFCVLIGAVFLISVGVFIALNNHLIKVTTTPTTTNGIISTFDSPDEPQPKYDFHDPQWWNHAVFYEIFVRSFYDSDGDGVGDFNGITQKLDYLNDGDPSTSTDLGINAIWLMPIFPTPSYHGYDVTDYFSVNPAYGTIEDFNNLLDEAHRRGIHVIIDFVLNHTSNQHPWFVSAQDPMDKFFDWYIWSNNDPGYLGPWNETVWHKAYNGLYYYGIFWEGMPDLNFMTPEVTSRLEEAAKFWLMEVGVDGFRIDGAKHLIEEGEIQENTKSTVAWFRSFKKLYKSWKPAIMTVGEIWDSSYITTSFINSDSFDMVFNFDLANAIITTIAMGDAQALSANIASEVELYNYQGMGTFLSNHDMNRVMSQLGNDVNLMKHAASVLLTIPGTPFLYYGEEIGMVGMKPDEQIRTPMQWSSENNGGFTTGKPWEVPNYSYKKVNVVSQMGDETSLLSFYRNLINSRLSHPALLDGEYEKVDTSNPALYAGIREMNPELILTIVNLKNSDIEKPVFKFRGELPPGSYKVEILVGNTEIDSFVEIVRDGEYMEFSFIKPIAPHENLVLQLLFDE